MKTIRLLGAAVTLAAVACGSAEGTTASGGGKSGAPSGTAPAPTATTVPDSDQPVFVLPPRREKPPGAPAPYPIVLMHGMAGFDKLTLPVAIEYWAGVVDALAMGGETK